MQNASSRSAHIGLGGYKLQFDTVFFQRCNLKCLNLCFSQCLIRLFFCWYQMYQQVVSIWCTEYVQRSDTKVIKGHVLAPNLAVPETPAAHHEAQQLVDPESLSTVSRHWSHPKASKALVKILHLFSLFSANSWNLSSLIIFNYV
jgi:hypothetical protein